MGIFIDLDDVADLDGVDGVHDFGNGFGFVDGHDLIVRAHRIIDPFFAVGEVQ